MRKPRLTTIDKTIAALEQEVAVLQLAIAKLKQQQRAVVAARDVAPSRARRPKLNEEPGA